VTDRRILVLRTALLWVLLELVAAAQVRTPAGELVLWHWVRATVSPVVWAGEAVGRFVGDMVAGVSDSANLVIENRRLRLELESARAAQRVMAEDLAAQRELGFLADRIPHLMSTAVPARITHRDLARGRMMALVTDDRRVAADTPAVTNGGVVGRVIRSEGRRCWIEVMTHPVAAIAVQTPDGRIPGLAVGGHEGELEIQFVHRQVELLRGTELVTSGADGIYPPGLVVGRVASVRESAGAFLEVRATPGASLATTRVVLLLDGWMGDSAGWGARR
jgi:rod shape-determining protein MreC